jgi:hypothetical protein
MRAVVTSWEHEHEHDAPTENLAERVASSPFREIMLNLPDEARCGAADSQVLSSPAGHIRMRWSPMSDAPQDGVVKGMVPVCLGRIFRTAREASGRPALGVDAASRNAHPAVSHP